MLRRVNLNSPLPLALLAVLARVLPTPRTIDDAFITFRYARNLLAGQGFVYNAGQRVLGTTTPLYTLLLAGLAGLTRSQNYPWLALLVNALMDAVTCLLLAALGEKLSGRRVVGLGAALLWAVAPMSVTFAIGGMETSLFILLMVGSAYLYITDHVRAACVGAALLLLARPDGALLVAPLALDVLWRAGRRRHVPAAEAGLFLAVLAPWLVFATLYFGSPIPHSISAKTLAYRLGPTEGFVRLVQHYGTPFFEQDVFGRFWPLLGFIVYLTLAASGGLALVRRNARAWPLVVYPWVYFVVFAAANPLIFRWYLAPPLPFYFLLILAGADRMLAALARAWQATRPALARALPAAPAAAFALLSLHAWTLHPDHGPALPAPQMAWHLLELEYEQLGRALAPSLAPGSVIAAGDVGALGYYSGARILDTVGLMSPEASRYFPLNPSLYVINYAMPPQLILDERPDYVVLLEVYGRNGLLVDPRFTSSYALAQRIDTDIYGSRGLLVYRRLAP